MPIKVKELHALDVKNLNKVGFHEVGGVPGLALQIVASTAKNLDSGPAKSWVLRTMIGGRRRKMGLGGFPAVTLAQAREKARQAREKIDAGIDPIAERRDQRRALVARRAQDVTFRECAESYIETHKAAWKGEKSEPQWRSTFKTYVYPVIGDLWVREVELSHIMEILEPIWRSKTTTAKRLRGRIESVLASAKTRNLRSDPNPATWKNNLSTLLPSPNKIKPVRHFPALPAEDTGAFVGVLRRRNGIASKALEFLILTNVRSRNVRYATWPEIDWKGKTWAIPGETLTRKAWVSE